MHESLTLREQEVLQLLSEGCSTKEIAHHLEVSFKTAACHRGHILRKLGARNTAEAIRFAVSEGILALPTREIGRSPAIVLEENRRERDGLRQALEESAVLKEATKKARADLRMALENVAVSCIALLQAAGVTPAAGSFQSLLGSVGEVIDQISGPGRGGEALHHEAPPPTADPLRKSGAKKDRPDGPPAGRPTP